MAVIQSKHIINDPAAPLFMLVHGRGGNYDVMSAFKRCFPENSNFFFPQAPNLDPELSGYSWWNIYERETLLQKALEAAELLHAALRNFIKEHNLNPSYIAACGFSQGAALISILLQKENKLFTKVGFLSGVVLEYPDFAKPASGTEIFMFHGTADQIIRFEKSQRSKAYLESLGYQVNFFSEDVAHKLGTAGMRALKDFFNE